MKRFNFDINPPSGELNPELEAWTLPHFWGTFISNQGLFKQRVEESHAPFMASSDDFRKDIRMRRPIQSLNFQGGAVGNGPLF